MPTFLVSSPLAQKFLLCQSEKTPWLRPRTARRDLTDTVIRVLIDYLARKRFEGLEPGKGVALLHNEGIETSVRDAARSELHVHDGLIKAVFVELRDWTLKARGRTREFPWGKLTAENAWLWIVSKEVRHKKVEPQVRARAEISNSLEIQVVGPPGSGKSTIAREIGILLNSYGFNAVVQDDEKQHKDGVYAVRLAGLQRASEIQKRKLVIRTIQVR